MDRIDSDGIGGLMERLEVEHFWGAVKFSFQDGAVTHVELTQTLKKHLADDQRIVVIVRK